MKNIQLKIKVIKLGKDLEQRIVQDVKIILTILGLKK